MVRLSQPLPPLSPYSRSASLSSITVAETVLDERVHSEGMHKHVFFPRFNAISEHEPEG